ncbi:MMPL family transporter [uncultured Abyssibacter sp.]|uniref:efflux RND transporter permease subunit n=1 Tax=uncultured Abyssibacter sp. TaxID=2320202 RepID=UPI0032B16C09
MNAPQDMSKLDRGVMAYGRWVTNHPWLTLLLSLIAVAAFSYPMVATVAGTPGPKLAMSKDYRVYFGPGNPQLQAFDQVQDRYTKNDNSLIVIEPTTTDNAFNRDTLALAEELTDRAWGLVYSLRVDSVTNYQHTEAEGDDLLVAPLVENAASLSDEELARIREIAVNEPLLIGRLTSESGHAVAVNVIHQLPALDDSEVEEVAAEVRALRDEMLEKYPDHNIYLTGSNFMSVSFSEASQQDVASLIPLMYLVIIVITWVLLRSIVGTIATLAVIMTSMMASVGLTAFAGIHFTPPSISAPLIVSTLAVADSIHVLVSMFANMREGRSKHDALVDSLRVNFMPILLTSVTTALGFLSINFADSPPLRDLGNIVAMGVIVAWLLSVSLLPAVMVLLRVRVPRHSGGLSRSMEGLGRFVVNRRVPVLIGSVAVTVLLCALVPQNQANETFVHYFDTSVKFRTDTDWVAENITGLYTMEFDLESPEGTGGVTNPEYLKQLDAFKQWWMEDPRVKHVASVSDIFKRLNKNMHGDDPAYYRIPDDPELAAQYLLLYEFSLPFGLDLGNQINLDKSATRFFVAYEHLDAVATRKMVADAYAWLETNAPGLETIGVSPAVMFAYIADRNIKSMFIGMPVALIGISFLLILALRSWKMGLLSLVPNLVPLGLAFGLWGIIDGKINFTMAIVLGMTVGIVVDDTIHFLSKYLRARRELGQSPQEAIVYSFRTVGTALTTTSLILVAGFAVLAQSAFLPNSGMAQLTSIAIICALIADFFLLPVLLLLVDRERAPTSETPEEDTHAYAH